ncbi:hypothetical protein FB451DRAFT_1562654 [Mycena latifolia]|nr:hypothetical protein FB451DRAFT_1562654 [Mycena latifolia]
MSTAALRRRLAELDAEIIDKKTALDELRRDRTAVQHQLRATATFPVLTLPVEITAEIFLHCLPSTKERREYHRSISEMLESQAPTLFLGVCRTWRDIALGTPALWATLSLCFDFIAEEVIAEPEAVEGFIDMWLGRAALSPLSLVFNAEFAGDSPFAPSRMRDVIHRYAHRLEYIELETSQHDIQQLGLDSVALPLLQRAAIRDNLEAWPDSSNPVRIYSNAPQLHHLIILGVTEISCYTPPWLQLTKFEGVIYNLDLFVLAPNLVEVKGSVASMGTIPTSPILHPNLQSLTLSQSEYTITEFDFDLLPHLTLPALQFLHTSDILLDSESPADSFCAFLTRSSPPLRTLSVRVSYDMFDKWDKCFCRVAATLENLELHLADDNFQYQVFNLGSQYSSYNPLPHLRTLHLVHVLRGTDFNHMVRFLRRRSTTPTLAKLRSFRLISQPGTSVQDILSDEIGVGTGCQAPTDQLALLASEGIDIHIGTTEKTYVEHVQYITGDPAYKFVS